MPRLIATLVSSEKATLRELQTFYGLKDAHDLMEIVLVDSHNRRAANANGH